MSTNVHNPADCRTYPDRWPRYRGKQLFKVIDDRSETGDEELLSVSHITGITPRSQKNVTMFKAESTIGYKRVQVGDIAANTMWTWQGAIGVSRYAGIVSPAYNVYRQRNDYYNPRFLDLLLREPSLVDVYHSLSTGIRKSRLRLYPGDFLTIDFPLPSREEQDAIVRFVDWKSSEINALIASQLNEIALLDNLKRSVINHSLETIRETECSHIKLKYLVDVNTQTLSENTSGDYTFRYLDISSVDATRGITGYETYSFDKAPSRARRVVHQGDLIVSTVRTYLRAIVRIEDDKDVIASTGFAVLTPKNIDTSYLEYCLRSDCFCDEVMRHSRGVAYPAINVTSLTDIKVPVPPVDLQHEIAQYIARHLQAIDGAIEQKHAEIRNLLTLKLSLIANIVSGQADVRDFSIPEFQHVSAPELCMPSFTQDLENQED